MAIGNVKSYNSAGDLFFAKKSDGSILAKFMASTLAFFTYRLGLTIEQLTLTDVDAQNAAPTIAQWLGGYITHNSKTGGGTLTTPTGAAITAGITNAAVGDSFETIYANRGNQTVTLTAGDGAVTLRGTIAVPTLKTTRIVFYCTSAGNWDCIQTLSA